MKWGLTQGIIGAKLASLSPSPRAVGPNTYLTEQDFLKMLGLAFGLHAIIFIIAGLFPHEKVTHIPVRALSFKLGDVDRVAAYGSTGGVGISMNTLPAPVIAAQTNWRAEPKTASPRQYVPVKPPKIIPVTPRQVPQENTPPSTIAPLPAVAPLTQPAIAPTPQQYVREVGNAPIAGGYGAPDGAIGGQGAQSTMTPQTAQQIRERYEQQISSWIQQHKFYPADANGREGRTVVRMRIDRTGYVRYYAIEQSSGVAVIDAAAIDMIRRANPVPAVPANYPAGNLIEFLIPITFHAPR